MTRHLTSFCLWNLFAVLALSLGAEEVTYLPDPLPDKPLVIRATTTSAGTLILSEKADGNGAKFTIPKAGELIFIDERAPGAWRAYLDGSQLPLHPGKGGRLFGVAGTSLNNLTIQENTEPRFGDDFMRDNEKGEFGGEWVVDSGTFSIAHEAQAKLSASPFHAVGRGSKGPCVAHVGRWYWNDYVVAVSFEYAGGTIGIDALKYKNGYVRFTAGPDGMALSVADAADGKIQVVAKNDIKLTSGWHQLAFVVYRGRTGIAVDMVQVLLPVQSIQPDVLPGSSPCGAVGMYVEGTDTRIDDVVVLPSFEQGPVGVRWGRSSALRDWWGSAPIVQTAFLRDAEMQLWSRRIGLFTFDRQERAVKPEIPLPTPCTVTFDVPKIAGDLNIANAGMPLVLARTDKAITVNGKEVSTSKGTCQLTVDSDFTSLRVDGNNAGMAKMETPVNKADLKFTGSLASLLLNSISVSGPNIRQFTFYRAPALFETLAGTWNESSLWACSPQYSWFQGRAGEKTKDRVAIVRYKEHLFGDFYMRAVIAIPMEGDQTPYYEFPINFGVEFVPQDREPSLLGVEGGRPSLLGVEGGRPVTCLFGLCDATTLLARGNDVVASNSDWVNLYVRSMFSLIKDYIHTTWYDLEIIRRGDKITMLRDGQKLIEADVKGLSPRLEAAFITGDNAVVISRLEIAADGLSAPAKLNETKVTTDDVRARYLALLYKDYAGLAKSHKLLAERADKAEPNSAPLSLPFDQAYNEDFLKMASMRNMQWVWGATRREGQVSSALPKGFSGYDGVELFESPGDDREPSLLGGQSWLIVVNRHVGGEMLLPLLRQPFDLRDYQTLELEAKIPPYSSPGLMMVVNGKKVEASLAPSHDDGGLGFRGDGKPFKGSIDLVNLARNNGLTPPYVCEMLAFNDPFWQSHTRGGWYAVRNIRLLPNNIRMDIPIPGEKRDDTAKLAITGLEQGAKCYPETVGITPLVSNVSFESVNLTISAGGAAKTYRFADGCFSITKDGVVWRIPPGDALPSGEAVLTARALWQSGNKIAASLAVTLDPTLDKTGPVLSESSIHLSFTPAPLTASFESGEDWGEMGIRGGMVLYPRIVSGVKCLALEAAPFNEWERYVFLKRNAFDVDELPLLRFRYRLRQEAQGWLGARVGHEVLAIFDSHNHRGQELQKRTMFTADREPSLLGGEWHTMVVDLRQALKEYLFEDDMGKRIVEQVFTNTPYWNRGNDRRIMYLDEVSLYPEHPDKLAVKVDEPSDAGGFGGLSFSVDNDEKGAAPAQVTVKGNEFSVDKPADMGKFLHVKAFDGAGNSGPDVTIRLFP